MKKFFLVIGLLIFFGFIQGNFVPVFAGEDPPLGPLMQEGVGVHDEIYVIPKTGQQEGEPEVSPPSSPREIPGSYTGPDGDPSHDLQREKPGNDP